MTVTYLHHLQSSGLGFYRILFLWAGSIYKGIWKTLITYCILYGLVTFIYRVILINYEDAKETFERFCVFANKNENNLPLNFILGFYVTQVVSQWWNQYASLAWPDTFAMNLASYCPGRGKAYKVRRQCVRYANLANTMAWRRLSLSVAKRFPTFEDFVQDVQSQAGLLTEKEKGRLERLSCAEEENRQISWAPIVWAQTTVRRAFLEDKLIPASNLFDTLQKDLSDIAKSNTRLINFAWVNIPLVYTQLVQIAVHIYFLFTLFGTQSLRPTYYLKESQNVTEENPYGWVRVPAVTPGAENHVGYIENVHALNLPIPLFSLLKFFFYFGWLHVSQVLINPLGDDDEDFDVNELLDRHLQISYLMVEGEENDNEEPEDPHNGLIPRVLPNMDEARLQHRRRPSQPFPTDHLVVARPRKTSLADGSWTTPILANRWLRRTLASRQREEGNYDEIEEIKEKETAGQERVPQRKKGSYGAVESTKEP